MQKFNADVDIASASLDILSQVNIWLLTRHQWMIKAMRCLVTGEESPTTNNLQSIDSVLALAKYMPDGLQHNLNDELTHLNEAWLAIVKSAHPLSGLELFHQLDQFQAIAEQFMQLAEESNQRLWQNFTSRDALTGSWTRLTMHTSLMNELKRAERHGHHCCIALLDQNKFKQINDVYGHATGDKVLIETARIIEGNLRSVDKLFRYGGDEWLILMPATTIKMAVQVLKRVCNQVAAHPFVSVNQDVISSTLSFGVAESVINETVETWITRADNAMYAMKSGANYQ